MKLEGVFLFCYIYLYSYIISVFFIRNSLFYLSILIISLNLQDIYTINKTKTDCLVIFKEVNN